MSEKADVNVLDALKSAAEGESASSTGSAEKNASPVAEGKAAESKKDDGMIPRTRYNEAVAKLEAATKTWDTEKTQIQSQLQEAQKSVATLSEVVKTAQEDRDLVAALRTLSKDPKHSDLILKVDNALQGIEDDVESGKSTPKEAQINRKQVMDELRGELNEKFTDSMHSLIQQQADMISKQYMERLPTAEYTESDKKVVGEMWANRVNWDLIEKDPSKLGSHLSETLQKTLDDYGVPRGKLASQKVETTETQQQQTNAPTMEDEVKSILGKDWGKLKPVKTASGAEVNVPELPEDEFNAEFAKLFKTVNRRG